MERGERLERISTLCWIATVVLEFGFQCQRELRREGKSWLLALIKDPINELAKLDEQGFEKFFKDGGEDALEPSDAVTLALGTRSLVNEGAITEQWLLSWVDMAWSVGAQQREIYDMEIEGSVMNETGMILTFAHLLSTQHNLQESAV